MSENDPMVEPALDAEEWQSAFEVYEGNPRFALTLAFRLIALKGLLQSEPKKIPEALAAIDRAVDSLYEHTEFRKVSLELYRAVVEGRITTDQENMIHELGIRT